MLAMVVICGFVTVVRLPAIAGMAPSFHLCINDQATQEKTVSRSGTKEQKAEVVRGALAFMFACVAVGVRLTPVQEVLKHILAFLNDGKVIRRGDWKPDEVCFPLLGFSALVLFIGRLTAQIEVLNKHLLLTAKPVIYLVNLSEKDYARKKNKWYAPSLLYHAGRRATRM